MKYKICLRDTKSPRNLKSFLLASCRSMTKIAGSGSICQRHGSADPDPYQNAMDPQQLIKTIPIYSADFPPVPWDAEIFYKFLVFDDRLQKKDKVSSCSLRSLRRCRCLSWWPPASPWARDRTLLGRGSGRFDCTAVTGTSNLIPGGVEKSLIAGGEI
jgi:hypothetical protein